VDLLVSFRIDDLVRAGVMKQSTSSLAVAWTWAGGTLTASDAIRIVGR
jgi:hypothetical protein